MASLSARDKSPSTEAVSTSRVSLLPKHHHHGARLLQRCGRARSALLLVDTRLVLLAISSMCATSRRLHPPSSLRHASRSWSTDSSRYLPEYHQSRFYFLSYSSQERTRNPQNVRGKPKRETLRRSTASSSSVGKNKICDTCRTWMDVSATSLARSLTFQKFAYQ